MGQQAAVTLLVAQERAPELDLPLQRIGLERGGSIHPQNIALGVTCSRKRRAEKRYLVIVMKNRSRARKKEPHNPELESAQCCPYSCCSRHRISPADPLSMLNSGRRFLVSLSPS